MNRDICINISRKINNLFHYEDDGISSVNNCFKLWDETHFLEFYRVCVFYYYIYFISFLAAPKVVN